MKELLKNIIEEIIADARADKLLRNALIKEDLKGDFYLVSVGKAAIAMAEAAKKHFSESIKDSLVITSDNYSIDSEIEYITGEHPYPGEGSLSAGKKLYSLLEKLKRGDQLLLLISGGASAMVEYPADGVSISEIADITVKLQKKGADIIELNSVRKHLSRLKGGRLAKLAEPANVFSFILSDVAGDRLDSIASGLTAPDKTTSDSAMEILKNYDIEVSENISRAIKVETPEKLRNVINRIIGNNELLCQIAAEKIMKEGYIPWLITTSMDGEARHYANMIPDIVNSVRQPDSRIKTPCIAICGGETTVKVTGNGRGGRNLELALNAAVKVKDLKGVCVATIASDGYDGNSGLAGAVIDENSYDRMLSVGMKPEISLKNNDSASILKKIDAVIDGRSSQTNLNDLLLILID